MLVIATAPGRVYPGPVQLSPLPLFPVIVFTGNSEGCIAGKPVSRALQAGGGFPQGRAWVAGGYGAPVHAVSASV